MTAPVITERREWEVTDDRVFVRVRREDAPDVPKIIAWARPDPDPKAAGAWEVRVLTGEQTVTYRATDKLDAKRQLADHTRKVAH